MAIEAKSRSQVQERCASVCVCGVCLVCVVYIVCVWCVYSFTLSLRITDSDVLDVVVWFGWMWWCVLGGGVVWVDVVVWFGWMWWCGLGGCGGVFWVDVMIYMDMFIDPHVKVVGRPEAIQKAREIILTNLDARSSRITLKVLECAHVCVPYVCV